jgi:hypothetical protein
MTMKDTGAINIFPKARIKPYDGMSVTADVWAQAHEEHRKMMEAHTLNLHGFGIVCGLEVTANDPPDQYVFISAGMAVDPTGRVIVLPEPVAYDFGTTVDGELYLMLGHGEREVEGVQREVKFIQNEFLVAARPTLPKRPAVELARVTLPRRGMPITNAADPDHPGLGEIDLRYRHSIEPQVKQIAPVGVVFLGERVPEVLSGWDTLNAAARLSAPYRLLIDELPDLANLSRYALLYLSGRGRFAIDQAGLSELRLHLNAGKMVILEAFDAEGADALMLLLSQLGISLQRATVNSLLYRQPYLFGVMPEGVGGNQVSFGEGVVFSLGQYALSWSGTGAARADIRSAHEFGLNLIHYCLEKNA